MIKKINIFLTIAIMIILFNFIKLKKNEFK